jgi:signal peptidase I
VILIWRQQLAAHERGIVSWKQMPSLRVRLAAGLGIAPAIVLAHLVPRSDRPLLLMSSAVLVGEPVWRLVWHYHEAHGSSSSESEGSAGTSEPAQADQTSPPRTWLLIPIVLALVLGFVLSFGALIFVLAPLIATGVGVSWKRKQSRRTAGIALIWIGVALFVARLVIPAVLVRTVLIHTAAMEPTIDAHDRVLIDRTAGIAVGDIVAFHPPKDASHKLCGPSPHKVKPGGEVCGAPEYEHESGVLVRRVVAGPGDEISIVAGHAVRNGTSEKVTNAKPCGMRPQCNFPIPVKVPPGMWFVLGDNRRVSDDSRFFGPVPGGWIIGVAIMRTWPPGRVGFP